MLNVPMTAEEKLMWDEIKAAVPYQKLIIEKNKDGAIGGYLIEKRQKILVAHSTIVALRVAKVD